MPSSRSLHVIVNDAASGAGVGAGADMLFS